jgi:hypothetical protein
MQEDPLLRKLILFCLFVCLGLFFPLATLPSQGQITQDFIKDEPVLPLTLGGNSIFPFSKLDTRLYQLDSLLAIKAPEPPPKPSPDILGLVGCLVEVESGGNPTILGDDSTSIGCLQMHNWWDPISYWQTWCVRYYGYEDVRSCQQQIDCAVRTLEEDFDQLYGRWPLTWKLCL